MDSTVQTIAKQTELLLAQTAKQFVQDNLQDATLLGEETVKAILSQAVTAKHAAYLEPLPAGSSPEYVATYAEMLAQRDSAAQLVAQAEAQSADRTAALKSNALKVAESIFGTIAGLGAAILSKALSGV